ncbi:MULTISPECIES: extensin family protein [unclassified Sinorhizobium]|uniref:extensin-like domain-containing protein n=1 Tax=unclassified Sinorhizobium TaxID=2613772 RepID=UPI003526A097
MISLTSATLPEKGPIPAAKPDISQNSQEEKEEAPAVPSPKPQTAQPIPPKMGPPWPPPPTIEPETTEAHDTCVKALQAMGATFKDAPRIDDGNGCGIDKPIVVSQVLPGMKLKPEGTMRCETALALAHWMKEVVIPAASIAVPDQGRITAINQASTYICRLRNGAATGKISEHARGNAVDVASFSFEKGEPVAVQPRREDPTLTGAFQRAVSASACLYFTTVLDPESDAAHETHFHLDVIERKGGFRFCR